MPVKDGQTKPFTGSRTRQYVNLRFCLRGGRKACRFLNELAGTNRYLWNTALTKSRHDYAETGQSQTSPFDLCKWYNEHRDTAAPWLRQYSVDLPRTVRKDLSDACKQFFQKRRGLPRFREKDKAKKSFAADVSGRKRCSTNGYVRPKPGMHVKMIRFSQLNRYANPVPKPVRIFEKNGNGHMTAVYEMDAIKRDTDGTGIGVDRNCGQVADNTGRIFYYVDTKNRRTQSEFLCLACGGQVNAEPTRPSTSGRWGWRSGRKTCRTGMGPMVDLWLRSTSLQPGNRP